MTSPAKNDEYTAFDSFIASVDDVYTSFVYRPPWTTLEYSSELLEMLKDAIDRAKKARASDL